jgi:putative DNA primase/helicase
VNSISEGGPERSHNSAREELRREILEAAILLEAGRREEAKKLSDLISRAELRASAIRDTAQDGRDEKPKLHLGGEVTKHWVAMDVVEYTRYRSPEKRETALSEIASNARSSTEYAAELRERSMPLATAAAALNFALEKEELERRQEVERVRRQELTAAQQAANLALIDANALARVGKLREQQSQAVFEALSQERPSSQAPRDERGRNPEAPAEAPTRQTLPAVAGQIQDKPASEEAAPSEKRAAKRPIDVEDVPDDLRRRYLVTIEGAGLLDRGRTEFSHRGGRLDGQLAFADSGRQLVTSLDDQSTARAMIEVAQAKGWKQVTLNGTDEFKRAAWMEARLQGMEVHGYEPREADKKRLAEILLERQDQRNTITTADRELTTGQSARGDRADERNRTDAQRSGSLQRDQAEQAKSDQKRVQHVDGDKLTEREAKTLEGLTALMKQKGFDSEFVNATTVELERRMRSQRVHVGELVGHGEARYKNDEKKDMSYFVTLRTAEGEQTVWGKRLGEAITEGKVQIGDQIVLTNTGKKAVTVQERAQDEAGRPIVRDKDSHLNAWTAQALVRSADRDPAEPKRREPTLMVYDRSGVREEQQRPLPPREQQRDAPGRDHRER